MEFIDLIKRIDVIEGVVKKRGESKDKLYKGQRVEFEVMDSVQVDDYSFAFVRTKNGRKGY
ncbi:hypothetical protein [Metallosphaera javensis (ex Sakai et al. 2022)]|uniref:hypothetical protein n=1 Tax=Metallosphaera javensis (ex Sakai et al. 2022) TaxID=2775498 RepID=UPI00258992AE